MNNLHVQIIIMLIFKQCQTILLLLLFLPHLLSGSVPSLKDKNMLFSFILFFFSLQKHKVTPAPSFSVSLVQPHFFGTAQRYSFVLSFPHSLSSSPLSTSVCVWGAMQPTVLYSLLLLVWSIMLSLSLMLALIPPALPSFPYSLAPSLSLLATSVIYAFMRVCMHAQAAERLSL